MELITLLHHKFSFPVPLGRGRLILLLMVKSQKGTGFLLSMEVYVFWFGKPVLWRVQ